MGISSSSKYTTPVFKRHQPDDTYKFQPLPAPTGAYPYHLSLETVQPEINSQKLVFHMVGDTGGTRNPDMQALMAAAMAEQYNELPEDQPKFLYHLGDIVYHHGEAENYEQQFFTPYKCYPGPIFAIAGNHDTDINPANPVPYHSLDAFTTVFCDTEPRDIAFDTAKTRKSMVQPNVYWTLTSPLANIIGLHSNVPKYGVITPEQKAWFIEELINANEERPEKALIICIHHAPYSADTNHGSSMQMIEFLEDIFTETGIKPDVVFSGHVHNYQRFRKIYADGVVVPYIVAGGGGFDELNALALTDNPQYTGNNPLFDNVTLQSYCDDRHGFLKIAVEKTADGLSLSGNYYVVTPEAVALTDSFSVKLAEYHLASSKQ
ncbi:hypothetical protein GCM10023149_14590 [Mucilaginibacter gynuensis]|uniref:Calcineurin-like phosphoesterase domain-containing protein n=1 Tax=Mucilaginibacter gynuensis TaxID=1302236 RepID=A0ABP8G4H5_9SPHI